MAVLEAHIARLIAYGSYSRELVALYVHRLIAHASAAGVGTFTVIFLFERFQGDIVSVLAVFCAIYALTGILSAPAAMLISRLGIRTLLLISLPLLALSNLALYTVGDRLAADAGVLMAIAVYLGTIALYRALYWIPYNTDLSLLQDGAQRGTQVALFSNIADIVVAIIPFVAGFLVASSGFGVLFLFAAIFTLISSIPLLWISNRYEEYAWTYVQTWGNLFRRETRPLLWGYLADGVQDGAQIILWPLLVYLLLGREYIAVGGITALTFLAILLIRFLAGKWFDSGKRTRALTWGAALSASGWIMKLGVATPLAIFLVDTYHGLGRTMNGTAVTIIGLEQAADQGRFVDEYTVLKEMALSLGRILVLALAGVTAWFMGIYIAFAVGLLLAAIATVGTIALARRVAFT